MNRQMVERVERSVCLSSVRFWMLGVDDGRQTRAATTTTTTDSARERAGVSFRFGRVNRRASESRCCVSRVVLRHHLREGSSSFGF